MATETPQERGKKWESDFARRIQSQVQPGSGNGSFAKMDVAGGSFLFSLKATQFRSYPLNREDILECLRAIVGAGGLGGEVIPAMAIRTADEEYIAFRLTDFLRMVEEKRTIHLQSKGEARRERAAIPALLRGDDDA